MVEELEVMTLWQVMTPTTLLGDQTYVRWRVAAGTRHEALRKAETILTRLGLTPVGFMAVDRIGSVYV